MDSIAFRLRWIRQKRGYSTAAEAAACASWNPVSYRAHERAARQIGIQTALEYARFFNCSPAWLAFGIGDEKANPRRKCGRIQSTYGSTEAAL